MAHIQLVGIAEPKCEDGKIWRFPYGLPLVAKQLSRTRHTYRLVDTHMHRKLRSELLEELSRCDAKYYGISAYSDGYNFTKAIAATIRARHPDAVIIVGGLLSRSDDALMEHTEVDIAVTAADGQYVLPELLDALETGQPLDAIKGITFRTKDGAIVRTPVRPILSKSEFRELDELPFDVFEDEVRDMVAALDGRNDWPVKGFPLLLARGCVYECTFCGHMHGKVALRHKWDDFFDRVEHICTTYGASGFYCYDAVFFYNAAEAEEFCRIYAERKCTFKLIINLRPTFGTPETYKLMAANGVRVILFGWETGSPRMIDVVRKKVKPADVVKTARAAAEAGIITYGNFLFGMPGENAGTVRETRQMMTELERIFFDQRADFRRRDVPYPCTSGFNYSILMALPTSEIFDKAVKLGMIEDMDAYLCSLDREDYSYKYIHARAKHYGSDMNFSLFSSRQAMVHYVRGEIGRARFTARLGKPFGEPGWLGDMARHAGTILVERALYAGIRLRDLVRPTRRETAPALKQELMRQLITPSVSR